MSYLVHCPRCEHAWPSELDPALTITCPRCAAAPGSPCKRPSGHKLFGKGQVHAERDLTALHTGACIHCQTKQPALFEVAT